MKTKERNISVILIGSSYVGKTCLILRYTDNKFNSSFSSTLGVDYRDKKIKIDDTLVRYNIWDTGGQEKFQTITRNYYDKAMGIILVYDCTKKKSYNGVRNWMIQIENHAKEDIVKVLVAAKCDEDAREVSKEEGEEMAKEYNIPYFETSSKTGMNVEEVFKYTAIEILNKNLDIISRDKKIRDQVPKVLKAEKTTKRKEDGKCC